VRCPEAGAEAVLYRRRAGGEHLLLQLEQLNGGNDLTDQDQTRPTDLGNAEDHRRPDDHGQRQRFGQRRAEAERRRHRNLLAGDHGDVGSARSSGRRAVFAGQAGIRQHPPLPLDR